MANSMQFNKMFSFEVKSRGHILAVVDENGFIVIYNTKKTGQLAIMDGMFLAHTKQCRGGGSASCINF